MSTAIAHSPEQAAELTSLSVKEIHRAIRSGELPAKRRGRRVLIPSDELRRWLDSMPDY